MSGQFFSYFNTYSSSETFLHWKKERIENRKLVSKISSCLGLSDRKKKLKYSTTFSIGRYDKIWKQREGVRKRRAICNERNVVHRLKKKLSLLLAIPCFGTIIVTSITRTHVHTRARWIHVRKSCGSKSESRESRDTRSPMWPPDERLPLTNVEFSHSRYNEASRGETTCACVKKKIKKLT